MENFSFFDSNLFQTIVIFLASLTAFIIYRINRYNEKKMPHALLLMKLD